LRSGSCRVAIELAPLSLILLNHRDKLCLCDFCFLGLIASCGSLLLIQLAIELINEALDLSSVILSGVASVLSIGLRIGSSGSNRAQHAMMLFLLPGLADNLCGLLCDRESVSRALK